MTIHTIPLTPSEYAVLEHRASVPDCIAEVLGPDNEDVWRGVSFSRALNRVEMTLNYMLHPDKLIFSDIHPNHIFVLEEFIDGNTLPHIVSDMLETYQVGDSQFAQAVAYKRAMKSLNAKLEPHDLPTFHI